MLPRLQICPLRTSGNSPLCPTGHWIFKGHYTVLNPLLQLITLSRAKDTADHMCGPWMTSFVSPSF